MDCNEHCNCDVEGLTQVTSSNAIFCLDKKICVEKIIPYKLHFITNLEKLADVSVIRMRNSGCKTNTPAVRAMSPDYIKMRLIKRGGGGECAYFEGEMCRL